MRLDTITNRGHDTVRKRQIAVIIGALISLVFLVLAFQGLNPAAFFDTLGTLNPLWLLAGTGVYFIAVLVITLRWQFLLRALKDIPLFPLTSIVAIGYMGNNVYPFRAGEALRIFLLKRNHEVPVARGAVTVVVERVFDGVVMLSFILLGLLLVPINVPEVRTVAQVAAPLFLIAVAAFFVMAAFPGLLRRLSALVVTLLPGKLGELVEDLSEDIIQGFEGLRSPVQLAGAVLASYATWAIEASVYWLVMFAFGLDQPYALALLVVGTVNLAGLLPASPGMIGVWEFFASAVMRAVGVPQDIALAYAIVVHVVIWLPITLVGFAALIRAGLGWSAVTHAQELEASAAR